MLARVGTDALCIICLLMLYTLTFQCYGSCSQDQTSPRANTLPDDADDIQRQLDNEARDRVKFGRISSRVKKQGKCFDLDHSCNKAKRNVFWDYKSQGCWKSKFPECGGSHQSPMALPIKDLTPMKTGVLTFCNFHIAPQSMTLTSDSHRITLFGEWPDDQRPMLFGGVLAVRRYSFHSLVFHWPSEHMVGDRRYPLESQAYFLADEYKDMTAALDASKDPQAILAIASLYNFANATQPALEPIIEEALYMGSNNESVQPEPLVSLIPVFTEYASYQGSLPVPPCTEAVLWLVPARTLPVTKRVMDIARSHIWVNGVPTYHLRRVPQKLNDRKVYYSKSEIQISQSLVVDQNYYKN